MDDAAIDAMESEVKRVGRFWLDAETYIKPVR